MHLFTASDIPGKNQHGPGKNCSLVNAYKRQGDYFPLYIPLCLHLLYRGDLVLPSLVCRQGMGGISMPAIMAYAVIIGNSKKAMGSVTAWG
jgi:hypothetical protein